MAEDDSEDERYITEVEDMLALLNEAPRRRVISYIETRPDGDSGPCVCEYPGEQIDDGKEKILAYIEDGGTAEALLDEAMEADMQKDMTTWHALPVRYGPFCSMWVSPAHGQAPKTPGAEE